MTIRLKFSRPGTDRHYLREEIPASRLGARLLALGVDFLIAPDRRQVLPSELGECPDPALFPMFTTIDTPTGEKSLTVELA